MSDTYETRCHPALGHAEFFKYDIVLLVQRDSQGITKALIDGWKHDVSATHHAVVSGFSLLTHSALSLVHLKSGTITYGHSTSMVYCLGMAYAYIF